MSLPLSNPHPLASLSGLWFMAGDRAKKAIAHVAETYRRIGVPEAAQVDADDQPNGVRLIDYVVADGVATIPVVGTLTKYPLPEPWMDVWCGTCPALSVKASIDAAMNDARVNSIVLIIDSPGGLVAGTSELVDAIAAYRLSQPDRPIHAAVTDCAASGGYYIASQCQRITCNAMGEVGCIGVYAVLVDDSKFWGDMGITFTVVSSGGVKGMGADGVVSEDLIADQQRGVDAMYMKFVADVATGRGITIDAAKSVATGQTWLAAEAMGKKLIDAIENVDDAIANVAASLSTNKPNQASSSKTIGSPAPQAGKLSAVADGTGEPMDATKRANLESIGLRTDASDTEAQTFYDLLNTDKQADADKVDDTTDTSTTDATASANKPGGASMAATLPDLIAACEGDKAAAADYAIAGMSVAQATAAYGVVKSARADSARADSASKDQKIAQLEYAAGGQKAIGTKPGASADGSDGTPEATAKAEWKAMDAGAKSKFLDEATFISTRKRELAAA